MRPPAALIALALALSALPAGVPGAEVAPTPRPAPAAVDALVLAEIKGRSELMTNLQHLSDVIGPRVTGSKNLQRANEWAAARMKAYGLENVRLEPWEIPVGWERGAVAMRLVEPDNGRTLSAAARAWTPGTNGKVTGDVVILNAKTRQELAQYKGKLKDAIILPNPPATVAPIGDLRYGPPPAPAPKAADKETGDKEKKAEPPAKTKAEPPKTPPSRPPSVDRNFLRDLQDFAREEGAACVLLDSAKPHGLLVTTGAWREGDRGTPQAGLATLYATHEHYALLYRLASRPAPAKTRAEVGVTNTFVPGPVTVFNTVGEIRGAEKPDEFVVLGGHLDSWDLGTGTTDDGTGCCVALEAARTLAALAAKGHRPARTIRFVMFTGEEQGLHGSKQYVKRHAGEMPKTSMALVHDTGTGAVTGIGLQGRESVRKVLEGELGSLTGTGFEGVTLAGTGGTDHLSFEDAGVPGFACRQDIDEYRLTHHTQTDTFDKAKEPNLLQGAQVMAVTALRVANLPELLPRDRPARKK
jgi:hypothetical protein